MNKTAHTRTPWAYHKSKSGASHRIWDTSNAAGGIVEILPRFTFGEKQPGAEAIANAEFIVRACNAHDDLVAALEAVVTDGECYCENESAVRCPCGHCLAVAALAKAAGGQ